MAKIIHIDQELLRDIMVDFIVLAVPTEQIAKKVAGYIIDEVNRQDEEQDARTNFN